MRMDNFDILEEDENEEEKKYQNMTQIWIRKYVIVLYFYFNIPCIFSALTYLYS